MVQLVALVSLFGFGGCKHYAGPVPGVRLAGFCSGDDPQQLLAWRVVSIGSLGPGGSGCRRLLDSCLPEEKLPSGMQGGLLRGTRMADG